MKTSKQVSELKSGGLFAEKKNSVSEYVKKYILHQQEACPIHQDDNQS